MKTQITVISVCFSLALTAAELPKAPPLLHPDERYKADLLLVVAHPDDDVVVGGYLARASLDQHKRTAVIYCTSGDGGGNAVGFEAGASLGQMRIIEARRALQFLGIENVWFLGGHDTPGQNVLWSLDSWNHGKFLDEIVRLVRLTRPNVILTFLPNYVVGENHDDHQAAGVLATEAFDLAGDPTRFPEQVSAPRDRQGMMNRTEGLHPWQPQKIYYFTDAFEDFSPYWHDQAEVPRFRKSLVDGTGPSYSQTEISPSRQISYARLAAEHQTFYQTQEGYLGSNAFKEKNFRDFEYPTHLIFGKSLVGGSLTGDVFEGVKANKAVRFAAVPGFHDDDQAQPLELAGPWRFYTQFWSAHGIENISQLLPVPEIGAGFGKTLHIPLLIRNEGASDQEMRLVAKLPPGWRNLTRFAVYPLKPGEVYPVEAVIVAPESGRPEWQELAWTVEAASREAGTVRLRAYLGGNGGLPQ
jgi:LmbE family N-acetylglucosaminyl deacetylase